MNRFDLDNAIQTKSEFSYAIAVMTKSEGWEEESWVGSKFAASMWIYTKAVICNGQNNMQGYRVQKIRSIMEAVNDGFVMHSPCDDALDDHVWVPELTISCQEAKILEALQYDLANPCMVQWSMLWFSAPTNLNRRFLNDGVILEKYNEAIYLAFRRAFILPFWRMNTPRSCFLRSIHAVLCRPPGTEYDCTQRDEAVGTG